MIKVKENTYWNQKGLLQTEYCRQDDELVPASGRCDSLQGEFLRAASRLYYRWYNDGDRIQEGGLDPDSSAENAWGFLHLESKNYRSSHWKMPSIFGDVALLAQSETEEEYSDLLESLMNDVIEFAKSRPLIPNTLDMCDEKYSEHCVEECDLHDYEEEEWDEEEDEE